MRLKPSLCLCINEIGQWGGVGGSKEQAIAVTPKVMWHQADVAYLVLFNLHSSLTNRTLLLCIYR